MHHKFPNGLGLDQLERLSSNSENGMKRKKTSQLSEFANKKIIIDALMLLLNLPSCSQYIVEVWNLLLNKFYINCLEAPALCFAFYC